MILSCKDINHSEFLLHSLIPLDLLSKVHWWFMYKSVLGLDNYYANIILGTIGMLKNLRMRAIKRIMGEIMGTIQENNAYSENINLGNNLCKPSQYDPSLVSTILSHFPKYELAL